MTDPSFPAPGRICVPCRLAAIGAVVLTVAGGLFAYRKLKVGAPMPTLAIDEAQKIRATVTAKSEPRG